MGRTRAMATRQPQHEIALLEHLPREEATLRVRHDSQVPSVFGTEPSDAIRGAVGIERVGFGGIIGIVDESDLGNDPVSPVHTEGEQEQGTWNNEA